MNVLDWILVGLLVLTVARGLFRGFVTELLSIAAPLVGLLAALLGYKPGAALLAGKLGVTIFPSVLAFVALFLLAFLLVKLLAAMLKEGLEALNLDKADKVLGALLGLLEGLVAASLVLLLIELQPIVDATELLKGSFFARLLLPLVGPGLAQALGGAAGPAGAGGAAGAAGKSLTGGK